MAALTLRVVKGSPLTNNEVDANFTSLDQAKVELAGDLGGSTSSPLVVKLYGRALSSSAPTTGQAIVWTGSGWAPGAAGLGTSTVVTNTTGNLTSSFTYAFSAYASNATSQVITTGSQQKVYFQLTEFNVGSFYSSTTSRFQPQVEGYYQLNSEVRLDGGPMGTGNEQMIAIWKNGAEYKRGWNTAGVSPNTSTWFSMTVGSLVYFNGSTDYAEIYVQHGNSGNLTVTGVNSPGITWFNGVMIPKIMSSSLAITSTSNIATYGTAVQLINQVLADISPLFDNKTQVFTLRNLTNSVITGNEYTDSADLEVVLDGRVLEPYIYDTHRWYPFFDEFDAGKRYSYKVTGNKIIFYTQPQRNNTVFIKINTKSASRQVRSFPFSPSHIAFGD